METYYIAYYQTASKKDGSSPAFSELRKAQDEFDHIVQLVTTTYAELQEWNDSGPKVLATFGREWTA